MKRILKIIALAALVAILAVFAVSCGGDGEETGSESDVITDAPTVTEKAPDDSAAAAPDSETVREAAETEKVVFSGAADGVRGLGENGELLYEESYDSSGRVIERTDYNEDEKVSIHQKNSYTSGNKEPDKTNVEEYTYDDNGELEEKTVTTYTTSPMPQTRYVYDKDGNMIQGYRYEYDGDGRIVKESFVNSKNVLALITEYEYSDGRVSKMLYKTGSGNLSSYTLFTYNASGKIEREENFSADGDMTSYIEYTYDDSGKQTSKTEYVPDGNGGYKKF